MISDFWTLYRLTISEQDAERMIDEADRDNDNQLSFSDFCEIVSSVKKQ